MTTESQQRTRRRSMEVCEGFCDSSMARNRAISVVDRIKLELKIQGFRRSTAVSYLEFIVLLSTEGGILKQARSRVITFSVLIFRGRRADCAPKWRPQTPDLPHYGSGDVWLGMRTCVCVGEWRRNILHLLNV
eukprot:scaffold12626_cov77-Cyclotella_meneghiniana.AAC.1